MWLVEGLTADPRFESQLGPITFLKIDQFIALDKTLFSIQKYWYFSYSSMRAYVVGTQLEVPR